MRDEWVAMEIGWLWSSGVNGENATLLLWLTKAATLLLYSMVVKQPHYYGWIATRFPSFSFWADLVTQLINLNFNIPNGRGSSKWKRECLIGERESDRGRIILRSSPRILSVSLWSAAILCPLPLPVIAWEFVMLRLSPRINNETT